MDAKRADARDAVREDESEDAVKVWRVAVRPRDSARVMRLPRLEVSVPLV